MQHNLFNFNYLDGSVLPQNYSFLIVKSFSFNGMKTYHNKMFISID